MTQKVLTKIKGSGSNKWQDWWSMKGGQMSAGNSPTAHSISVASPSGGVSLSVSRDESLSADEFLVEWSLLHGYRPGNDKNGRSLDDYISGRFVATRDEVAAMFGLADKVEYDPLSTFDALEHFGATCYIQGRFLRDGRRLNVPGPTHLGTSFGATNVSIFITDEMVEAIEKLITPT